MNSAFWLRSGKIKHFSNIMLSRMTFQKNKPSKEILNEKIKE